jgi:hypothetical protein
LQNGAKNTAFAGAVQIVSGSIEPLGQMLVPDAKNNSPTHGQTGANRICSGFGKLQQKRFRAMRV